MRGQQNAFLTPATAMPGRSPDLPCSGNTPGGANDDASLYGIKRDRHRGYACRRNDSRGGAAEAAAHSRTLRARRMSPHTSALSGLPSPASAPASRDERDETFVVPLHEETLSVARREIETGRVRVEVEIHERQEIIEQDLAQEVPITGAAVEPIRQDGHNRSLSLNPRLRCDRECPL